MNRRFGRYSKLRILFMAILLLGFIGQTASSRQYMHPTLWKTFVSIGYANAASSDIGDHYAKIVNSYRFEGISIPTQTPFGRTIMVNAGFLFTRLEDIWFGLSIGYLHSPAYSSYKDYAGTLKINGSISSYELTLKVKATAMRIGNMPIDITVQPGFDRTYSFITQELRYYDLPQYNYNAKWSTGSWGPCLQGTVGTSLPVGKFFVSLEGGYRFGWDPAPRESGKYEESVTWNIGHSGYVLLLTLDMGL
jgi:hypothetical protein